MTRVAVAGLGVLACAGLASCADDRTLAPDAGLDGSAPIDADSSAIDVVEAGSPPPPPRLSQTGLYSDIGAGIVASGLRPYEPRFPFWSDAAENKWWIFLPPKSLIDTSNMDHWSFPVGTKLFKEFRFGGVRVETRMVERWGPGRDDFRYAPYQWNAAQTDADYVAAGVVNANGTSYDIMPIGACDGCHSVLREHVLGFSAVQLSHSFGGVTLDSLIAEGRLTAPPAKGYAVPGDTTAQEALGYLHANCGNCHNADDGVSFLTPFSFRLLFGDQTVQDTGTYKTSVGIVDSAFQHTGITMRITPGDPWTSAVSYRMWARGFPDQMPPVGTKVADPVGQAAVNAWILTL